MRDDFGIRRRVIFQAWCNGRRSGRMCEWKGPEREYRGDAEFDRANHEVDAHGGSWTRDEEKAS